MDGEKEEVYYQSFFAFLDILEDHSFDVPEYLKELKCVVVDISQPQRKGWQRAVSDWFDDGEELAALHIRGCYYHWMQSCERVAKIVAATSEEATNACLALCSEIPRCSSKVRVYDMFGAIKQAYPNTSSLFDWWLKHKDMLCRCWSSNTNFDSLPTTSNIAESQNAILGTIAHDHISIYFRSILKMDELLFSNIYAHELGVRLRYYSNGDNARRKRKQNNLHNTCHFMEELLIL